MVHCLPGVLAGRRTSDRRQRHLCLPCDLPRLCPGPPHRNTCQTLSFSITATVRCADEASPHACISNRTCTFSCAFHLTHRNVLEALSFFTATVRRRELSLFFALRFVPNLVLAATCLLHPRVRARWRRAEPALVRASLLLRYATLVGSKLLACVPGFEPRFPTFRAYMGGPPVAVLEGISIPWGCVVSGGCTCGRVGLWGMVVRCRTQLGGPPSMDRKNKTAGG